MDLISNISESLPNLDMEAIEEVKALLLKLGIQEEKDLAYVTESDLMKSSLSVIQIRKLLAKWTTKPGIEPM